MNMREDRLRQAAQALRDAQKAYMANRKNPEYGKQVAVKAKELDVVLGEYDTYGKVTYEEVDQFMVNNQGLMDDLAKSENKTRPPYETFVGATCRGSIALGNNCGTCEKCEWEKNRANND